MKRNRIPWRLSSSSIVSRVVPAMSLTMARSSRSSVLRRVDLPTFGLPAITTGMPFRKTLPSSNERIKASNWPHKRLTRPRSCSRLANSTSSSEKSSSNSIRDAKWMSSARRSLIFLLKPPRICCKATRWAAAEPLAMRSATASACDRSNFPFRKARSVYSPGSANRAPCWQSACKSCCWMNGEP